MKVAILLPHALRGGIENICLNLLTELQGSADTTLLISEQPAYPLPVPDGVRIHELRANRNSSSSGLRPLRTLSALPALRSYLKQESPDVLLSFQAPTLGALAIATTRTPTVFIVRESNSLKALRGSKFQVILKRRLRRFVHSRAHAVIALCNEMAEELSKFGLDRSKIHVIYNPTVTKSMLEETKPAPQHEWFGADSTIPVITSVGRMDWQKDQETLIRAFAIVVGKQPCRLVLLGDGHLREKLTELINQLNLQDNVLLPGYVPQPQHYIANSTLFVQSSIYEGLANSIIEAQACGVPVVATECPTSPREILLDGDAGTLVPMGDAEALADAILTYLNDPKLRQKHAQVATKAIDRFSSEANSRKYLQLMEQLTV